MRRAYYSGGVKLNDVPKFERPEQSDTVQQKRDGISRALGLGLITGAADDDPSAIGTYPAQALALGLACYGWLRSPCR